MFRKLGAPVTFDLDPFAFWPGARSRIDGLGGNDDAPEPDAVFHTCYSSFDAGPLTVEFTFDQLAATHGRMLLHAIALPDDSSAAIVQSNTLVDLLELVATGGRFRLPVIVKPHHAYAFMARIVDNDTDARASALTIQTDQQVDGAAFARKLAAAKHVFRAHDEYASLGAASLASVRSQMCTAAQFTEPDYDRWIA